MNTVSFQSQLLQEVAELCARKSKSLRYRGKVGFERGGGEGDRAEWLRVTFKPGHGPATIVELLANRYCNVYVRSTRGSDRGKVLVRVELMSVTGNADRITDAIIGTMGDVGYDSDANLICSHWRTVSLAMVTERSS